MLPGLSKVLLDQAAPADGLFFRAFDFRINIQRNVTEPFRAFYPNEGSPDN
jgi:hypothetical protein